MPALATVAAFGFAEFHPPTLLKVYRRLGCRTCQFYRNTSNPPAPAQARRIALDADLPIDSVHGVFGPSFDPSSPDEAVRRQAVDTYRREGELALELGGSRVVVHPAPMAQGAAQLTDAARAQRVSPMDCTMRELAEFGRSIGVTYLFENIPGNYCFGHNPAQLAAMIRQIDSPFARMCFDFGHAHMTGDVAAALEACLDVIGYLHVHDNDSRQDAHLVPGNGTIPWEQLSQITPKLAPSSVAMLELFWPEATVEDLVREGFGSRITHWLAAGE